MPNPKKKNAAAAALGRRGKGKPKTLTPAALHQRRMALVQARAKSLPPQEVDLARETAQDARATEH